MEYFIIIPLIILFMTIGVVFVNYWIEAIIWIFEWIERKFDR